MKDQTFASVNILDERMQNGSVKTSRMKPGVVQRPNGRLGQLTGDPDLDLLHCYANFGDTDSFAKLVERYAGFVYATCLRVLGDSARAEDVCQEAFFRLMSRPHDVNHNVGAWLHRTATHLALDAMRSDSARRRREIVYTRDCNRDASTWSELSPAVDQAMSELPDELRSLLVRHFLLGESQAQLAAESEQSPATISRRVRQGLEELRQRLRLKGISAIPATMAALFLHVSARQAPASLLRELGKITMVGGSGVGASTASVAAKGGATGLGRAARMSRFPLKPLSKSASARFFSAIMRSQLPLVLSGMIGAMIALQFLTGAWTLPSLHSSPRSSDPELQQRQQGVMSIEGLDQTRTNLMRNVLGK
jgi:RNA polymerase sigma factor (sigma-70 family)